MCLVLGTKAYTGKFRGKPIAKPQRAQKFTEDTSVIRGSEKIRTDWVRRLAVVF